MVSPSPRCADHSGRYPHAGTPVTRQELGETRVDAGPVDQPQAQRLRDRVTGDKSGDPCRGQCGDDEQPWRDHADIVAQLSVHASTPGRPTARGSSVFRLPEWAKVAGEVESGASAGRRV